MRINTLKFSLLISIIGIFLLLIISNISEPRLIQINSINDNLINKKVQVQGIIFNIKSYKESNFQVISVKDKTGKIDITTNKILNLKNNQTIIITGTVQEYKQDLQVQADKISLK